MNRRFYVEGNPKCFIKINNGIYEEITLKELQNRRKKSSMYQEKKFILVDNILLEVSISSYEEYYREYERNRYCDKILDKLQVISIEELQTEDDIRGIDIIPDKNCNVEMEVIKKLEIEKLKEALLSLNDKEYNLIKKLFFDEKTVREYAKMLDIPYATIQYRKLKILKKLKKFLEN